MGRRVVAMVVEVQDYAVKCVHCLLVTASALNPTTVIIPLRLVRIVPELRQLTAGGSVTRAILSLEVLVSKISKLVKIMAITLLNLTERNVFPNLSVN